MDVEHPELAISDVPEPVDDADRRGDVRAGAEANGLVSDDELGFALEYVEGVDLVGVAVRLDALEVRAEPEFDHFEVGQLGEDPVVAGPTRDLLAPVGAFRMPSMAVRSYIPIAW